MTKKGILLALIIWPCAALAFEGRDAYGPGVHADKTGRAFTFEDERGRKVPQGRIQIDLFGRDKHQAEDGRPVRAKPLDGNDRHPLLLDR